MLVVYWKGCRDLYMSTTMYKNKMLATKKIDRGFGEKYL